MPEETFSIKEMMQLRFDEQAKHLDEIKADGKEALNQIKIQNGRVRSLEDWSNDAKKIIENTTKIATDTLSAYKSDRRLVWFAYALLILVSGTIISLAIMAIDSKIKDGITQALQENVSVIQQDD